MTTDRETANPSSPSSGEPVLSIRNLRTTVRTASGPLEIVKGISFDIHQRETVAVVGESGSGKSVSALSTMRLMDPETTTYQGSVKLGGRELLSLSEAEMERVRGRQIGMIFQEAMTSLNPVRTIGQQIAETLVIHGIMSRSEAAHEAVRLLERVRMPAAKRRVHDYPHNFSGGMRQRAMIAMALACKPKLLIADEPTTALDVTIQAQILQLIKDLQEEEGMGVLFITHDMGVVAEIADRTVVMLGGETVESGTTGAIFAEAEHPYTRALIAAVPRLGTREGNGQPEHFPIINIRTGEAAPIPARPDTVRTDVEPALRVQNLIKRFDIPGGLLHGISGRIHAVENLSFEIRAGETLALVGESGCGKSTTGRAIMRLIEPQSGKIVVDGADMRALNRDALRRMRRNIQMIFQDPFASLNPRMSVGQAIAEPMITHGLAKPDEARKKALDLLQQVGLHPAMAQRFPQQFSGGQRQRICIARALALEPKILVADESVSALDVTTKAQVVNLMLDLQQSLGLAYLFISHDMAVVERISHRVAVMYLGEIVEIGPTASVFANPQHPYTKRLIAAVPVPDPSRRNQRIRVPNDEIRSPIRPADFQPRSRAYQEVSVGHLVQEWDNSWGLQQAS